jgi:hypothetical protein
MRPTSGLFGELLVLRLPACCDEQLWSIIES